MRRLEGTKAFWALWTGMLVSFTGSGLTRFGLSVWVYQETRDALAFSGLLFFAVVPIGIAALVAGPLVDRLDRRRTLVVANVAASVPTLGVLAAYLLGDLSIPMLWAAVFVNGVANAFVLPALDASVRMLVPPEGLARASGFVQTVQTVGLIVAPPLAGLLMAGLGLASLFAIDLVTAALGVAALTLITVPRPERTLAPADVGIWRDFRIGLRYVLDRPPFLVLMAMLVVATFAGALTYAASGPLVLGFADERAMGITYAAYGIGSVAAAVAVGATGGPADRMRGIVVAGAALGAGSVLAGWRPDVVLISLGVLVIGAGQSTLIALHRAIFQIHALPEVLGRVFSLRLLLAATSQAAGMLLTGWLVAEVLDPALAPAAPLASSVGTVVGTGEGRGAGLLLVLSGATVMLLAGILWAIPAVRGVESRLEDAAAAGGPAPPTASRG